ncbi:MAG: hypothetical protein GX066_00860 [Clostridiaceae bacterium]|nr:hypothetical protein [Clostridiaceae bacterium]
MVYENSKQVVIIKNIKSNIIEEAIFILKDTSGNGKEIKSKYTTASSDYILQEAQEIIDNYIKQHALGCSFVPSKPKIKNLRKWNISVGVVLNIALIISIALFIFLLSRAF